MQTPCRKCDPWLRRCHLALHGSAADTQTAHREGCTVKDVRQTHWQQERHKSIPCNKKKKKPEWRRASVAKLLLINSVSGGNYVIWFLLLHHSRVANDIWGSSSVPHTSTVCDRSGATLEEHPLCVIVCIIRWVGWHALLFILRTKSS